MYVAWFLDLCHPSVHPFFEAVYNAVFLILGCIIKIIQNSFTNHDARVKLHTIWGRITGDEPQVSPQSILNLSGWLKWVVKYENQSSKPSLLKNVLQTGSTNMIWGFGNAGSQVQLQFYRIRICIWQEALRLLCTLQWEKPSCKVYSLLVLFKYIAFLDLRLNYSQIRQGTFWLKVYHKILGLPLAHSLSISALSKFSC